jgi:hypothetical protein
MKKLAVGSLESAVIGSDVMQRSAAFDCRLPTAA